MKTRIKIGSTVRLKGKKRTAVVVGKFSDIVGGVQLDKTLDGFYCWNVSDLELAEDE